MIVCPSVKAPQGPLTSSSLSARPAAQGSGKLGKNTVASDNTMTLEVQPIYWHQILAALCFAFYATSLISCLLMCIRACSKSTHFPYRGVQDISVGT